MRVNASLNSEIWDWERRAETLEQCRAAGVLRDLVRLSIGVAGVFLMGN